VRWRKWRCGAVRRNGGMRSGAQRCGSAKQLAPLAGGWIIMALALASLAALKAWWHGVA